MASEKLDGIFDSLLDPIYRVQILGAKHFLFHFNSQKEISDLTRCPEICHFETADTESAPVIHLFGEHTMNERSCVDKTFNNSN